MANKLIDKHDGDNCVDTSVFGQEMAAGGPSEHCIAGFRHLPCVNDVGRRAISLCVAHVHIAATICRLWMDKTGDTHVLTQLNRSPTASPMDLCIRKTVIIDVFHFARHCYKLNASCHCIARFTRYCCYSPSQCSMLRPAGGPSISIQLVDVSKAPADTNIHQSKQYHISDLHSSIADKGSKYETQMSSFVASMGWL
jgi:hypothetical protein